jgi:Zn-dependent protease with chaperone function
MPTDFFQRQDDARRMTGRLLVLYALGILGLAAAVYAVAAALFYGLGHDPKQHGPLALWHPELAALTLAGVGGTVGLGSAYKVAELARGGGRGVAELLGGKEVPGNTPDPALRRLLNVVEEMSLASGTRMPSVYVLEDEPGVNAFAAGVKTDEAVVAVSRGCLRYLTRDELQGVVAHEFSHILNGDMRRNVRLMGLLHGLLMVSLIGNVLMRSMSGPRRRSSNDDNKGDPRAALMLFGLALLALGWIGVLFGRLIQAAVSRQREYLADASAVQFTRNPEGIAGALKKIGGLAEGSALKSPTAGEAAHMFFASGVGELFATHPPLADRVRRLDPQFNGEWPDVQPVDVPAAEARRTPDRGRPTVPGLPTLPGLPHIPIPVLGLAPGQAEGRAGTVTPDDLGRAAEMHADLPDELRAAAGEPFSARALVLALLLDFRSDVRAAQLAAVEAASDPLLTAETLRLSNEAVGLSEAARLPLADLSVAALRQMSPGQYAAFRAKVEALIAADGRVSPFEATLRTVVLSALDKRFGVPAAGAAASLAVLRPKLVPVLSALAHESRTPAAAFARGVAAYGAGGPPLAMTAADPAAFDAALRAFAAASPGVRRAVVAACVACVAADGAVAVREAELLRAVAAAVDCPVPMGFAAKVAG